jgi:regulator of replication initiation timing
MDLETIKKKLKEGNYSSHREWMSDLCLIFDNAVQYNGPDSVTAGMAVYLRRKADKMIGRLNYFNHQNFEERIRSIYCEIGSLTTQVSNQKVNATPRYEVRELEAVLNSLPETTDVEKIIKQNGDQRVLKKAKEGVVNLDYLSRKTLDALWTEFGAK